MTSRDMFLIEKITITCNLNEFFLLLLYFSQIIKILLYNLLIIVYLIIEVLDQI